MSTPGRHPLAKADIERLALWYAGQRRGLGVAFVDEVERVVNEIGENPLRFSVRFGNWRRANLRRFPQAVFFQIKGGRPVIYAVLHARSDFQETLESRK